MGGRKWTQIGDASSSIWEQKAIFLVFIYFVFKLWSSCCRQHFACENYTDRHMLHPNWFFPKSFRPCMTSAQWPGPAKASFCPTMLVPFKVTESYLQERSIQISDRTPLSPDLTAVTFFFFPLNWRSGWQNRWLPGYGTSQKPKFWNSALIFVSELFSYSTGAFSPVSHKNYICWKETSIYLLVIPHKSNQITKILQNPQSKS